jgi:hypothetical protein
LRIGEGKDAKDNVREDSGVKAHRALGRLLTYD